VERVRNLENFWKWRNCISGRAAEHSNYTYLPTQNLLSHAESTFRCWSYYL